MYGFKGVFIVDVVFNLFNIFFLIWIDFNCFSWNWILFDNILVGRKL